MYSATYLKDITRWTKLSLEVKEIISHHNFPVGLASDRAVGIDLDGYGHWFLVILQVPLFIYETDIGESDSVLNFRMNI